jgi:N-acetylneuraminate synthase/N,N'-diacetyllegionaminate synthase
MTVLRELFPGPVGYSDHTPGHHAALAAVALGAEIVEKHIALDFDVANAQDWKVAAGPEDFPDFVRSLREVESSLGRAEKALQPCEEPALEWALKYVVAATDLEPGTELGREMLTTKRARSGIPASDLGAVTGHRVKRRVAKDTPLNDDDLLP